MSPNNLYSIQPIAMPSWEKTGLVVISSRHQSIANKLRFPRSIITEPLANAVGSHLLNLLRRPFRLTIGCRCRCGGTVFALIDADGGHRLNGQDLPVIENLHLLAVRLDVAVWFPLLHHLDQLGEISRGTDLSCLTLDLAIGVGFGWNARGRGAFGRVHHGG